jgi:hypothetical protein
VSLRVSEAWGGLFLYLLCLLAVAFNSHIGEFTHEMLCSRFLNLLSRDIADANKLKQGQDSLWLVALLTDFLHQVAQL